MNVSLILFGQGRYVERCYDEIKSKILDIYNPDVFCHLWWDEDIKNNGYIGNKGIYSVPSDTPKIIEDLYSPKKFLIEEPFKNRENINDIFIKYPQLEYLSRVPSSEHYLSQLYSFQKVSELFDWKNYDLIIKWRYDITPINFPNINELDVNYFYPTNSEWPTYENDNEMFVDTSFIMPGYFERFTKVFDNLINDSLDIKGVSGSAISVEYIFSKQMKFLNFFEKMIKLPPNKYQVKVIL